MNRSDILDTAKHIVNNDRNSTYGTPEDSFTLIAEYWSIHFGINITPYDVAIAMALLKVARLHATPAHTDSWVDAVGYMACGGEIALKDIPRAATQAESPLRNAR